LAAPTEPPRSGAALELLRGGAENLLTVRDVAERLGVCTCDGLQAVQPG
jgi:hypothetical protein